MSERKSVAEEKSLQFAVRMVKLSRYLREEKREYELASQVLRSGTSIGANIHEAHYAQSTGDFVAKMSISLKEASETGYWLRLLHETEILSTAEYHSLQADCEDVRKILASIVKSTKEKLNS